MQNQVLSINNKQLEKLGIEFIVKQLKLFWMNGFFGNNLSPPRSYSYTKDFSFTYTSGQIESPDFNFFGFRSYISNHDGDKEDDLYIIYERSKTELKSYFLKSNDIRVWRCSAISLVFLETIGLEIDELKVIGCGKINTFLSTALLKKLKINFELFSKTRHSVNVLYEKLRSFKYSYSKKNFKEGKNLYLVATDSKTPVLLYNQLPKDWIIIHIGPKYKDQHDIEVSIYENADIIITDSLIQLKALEEKLFYKITNKVFDLSTFLTKEKSIEQCHKRIIFSSIGISASELLICSLIIKNEIYE